VADSEQHFRKSGDARFEYSARGETVRARSTTMATTVICVHHGYLIPVRADGYGVPKRRLPRHSARDVTSCVFESPSAWANKRWPR
jgi:hypothetical protein